MSNKVTQVEIQIPDSLTKRQRLDLADLIIEHIVERTHNGKDRFGRPFPKYSKDYMQSLDFKNAGKSSKVDLQLSGDMLASIKRIRDERGSIEIGVVGEAEGRAEGNILGSYGGEPNKKKARDFLGIEPTKLKKLIEYVKDSVD